MIEVARTACANGKMLADVRVSAKKSHPFDLGTAYHLSLCQPIATTVVPRHSISLPDYSARLLSISGTLERDGRDGLRFPYPEARPDSARQEASPEDSAPLSGQNSWTRDAADQSPFFSFISSVISSIASLFSFASYSVASAQAPPAQDPPIPAQSQPSAVQNTPLFLPFINSANTAPAPLGERAVFQILLPNPARLADDLRFSEAQVEHVQTVVAAEQAAIAALDTKAAVIVDDR